MEPYGYCTVGNQLKEFKQKRERVDYAVAKKLCVGEEISDTFASICGLRDYPRRAGHNTKPLARWAQ